MKYFSLLTLSFFTLGACSNRGAGTNDKALHLAFSDDIKSGDPATSNDVISATFQGHIFEGLLSFSYLGKLGTIEPDLASAMPVFSDHDKTITFKLREGVLFQDDAAFPGGKGRAVVAEDFVYSIKRIADPTNNSPNWWMFDGIVLGFNEWRSALEKAPADQRKALFEKPVSGLSAADATTLVIKLSRPYPQLMPILTMAPTAVMAREVVEKYGPEIISHPVGTGAYRLKEWVRGSKIVMVKNPSFRKELYPTQATDEQKAGGLLAAAGRQVPLSDEIDWDIIKEEQPLWLKFRTGQLDSAGIPKDNFAEVIDAATGGLKKEIADKGVILQKMPSLTSWWLEFNLKDPVIGKNLKLRQALARALDRARVLDLLRNNRGVLSKGPVPPALEGGSDLPDFPYSHNIEAAKKLLAEAGYPEGKGLPELSFDLRGPGTTARQMGELLAENFGKIGIKLKVLANSFPEALEKQKTSRFQMMMSGWAADYPDPENFLQLFYSANAAPGTNSSNFINKEYDSLYEKIRTELPGPSRIASIKKMVEILNREVPGIFTYHDIDYTLSRVWLKNFFPNLLAYNTGKYFEVDTELKAKTPKSF